MSGGSVSRCAGAGSAHDSDEGYAEATVSMLVVRRLVELVERGGIPRRDILQAAGIDEQVLARADASLSTRALEPICELATRPPAAPGLALCWARQLSLHSFSPVSHALVHMASLREALDLVRRYGRLFSTHHVFVLEEQGEHATLRIAPWSARSPRVRRFRDEMVLGGFLPMLRRRGATIERVCFAHAAPDYRAQYAPVFGPAVCFDQPFTGIVFERAALDRQNPDCDREVGQALTSVLDRRLLRAAHDAPYAARVRELLLRPGHVRLGAGAAARKLGLSARSLRRRLAAERVSFREIQVKALASVAEQLLEADRLSVQETAHALGFTDTSAFHRAFKRWTGTTPRAIGQR